MFGRLIPQDSLQRVPTERCPAAPSGKRSPHFLFSVVTCCTSALLFLTFIPHTVHGEISTFIPLYVISNMILTFKSLGLRCVSEVA